MVDNYSPSTRGAASNKGMDYMYQEEKASTCGESYLSSGSGSGSTEGDTEAGYDYDFVAPVDEKYECPICCFVLRSPNQTKCGHRFCNSCIRKWINEKTRPAQGARCPICSEELRLCDIFSDNFAKREILSLKVRCPQKERGCEVIIEVRHVTHHLLKCDFVVLPCLNGCLVLLMRKDMNDHLRNSCERRLVDCPVCSQQIIIKDQEMHLKTECPLVEVICELCSAEIHRSKMKSHMNEVCPKMLVDCVFSKVGCTTKIERDQLDTHLHLSTQAHLKMLAETVELLQVTLARSSKMDPMGVEHLMTHEPPPEFAPLLSGPMTLPSFAPRDPYPQSISNPDSDMDIIMTKLTRSSPDSLSIHLAQPLKESITNVSSPTSRLTQQHLDIPNIPTGYSKPTPSSGPSSTMRELELHSAPSRSIPRQLRRQSSLGGVEETSGIKVSSLNRDPLHELVKDQRGRLAQQQQQIASLQTEKEELKQELEEQKGTIKNLREEFKEYTLRNCSGTFIWKVQNYTLKKMEAQRGTKTVIHSDGFYSSMYGYKLCVRLNINGVESATGTHISLFVHFMQGDYDDILEWPFSGRISLAILDQTEATQFRQHITETLLSKATLAAFQRPHTPRNHKGFGYVEFSPFTVIEGSNPRYVKNDTIFIKVHVETN